MHVTPPGGLKENIYEPFIFSWGSRRASQTKNEIAIHENE